MSLDVTTEQHPGQTRVVLSGELDIASADGLEKQLAAIEVDSPATLVLDLRARGVHRFHRASVRGRR